MRGPHPGARGHTGGAVGSVLGSYEVTKLRFLGFRSTRILLGFAKDSHLYKDLAIIYGDFALIWIWISVGFGFGFDSDFGWILLDFDWIRLDFGWISAGFRLD